MIAGVCVTFGKYPSRTSVAAPCAAAGAGLSLPPAREHPATMAKASKPAVAKRSVLLVFTMSLSEGSGARGDGVTDGQRRADQAGCQRGPIARVDHQERPGPAADGVVVDRQRFGCTQPNPADLVQMQRF